ncbi:MAG: hypothetical protein QM778_17420 [Myxococcales bacterium]
MQLDASQQQKLMALLHAMKTTKGPSSCTTDVPTDTLTVFDRAGTARVFLNSINAGCDTKPAPGTMLVDYTGGAQSFVPLLLSLGPTRDGG